MSDKLTYKQYMFCNFYVECRGNDSEAYRCACDALNMTDRQIWEEASKLLNTPKVAQRIKELQTELKVKSGITEVASILTNSAMVLKYIKLPIDWKVIWPMFYVDLTGFKQIFRANKNDNSPDVLTGIVEKGGA